MSVRSLLQWSSFVPLAGGEGGSVFARVGATCQDSTATKRHQAVLASPSSTLSISCGLSKTSSPHALDDHIVNRIVRTDKF